MSRVSPRRRGLQEGFTLIELLVVVLIIGILASIAIPAFLGQRRKAQDSAAKSLIRSGVIAAESYYTESINQSFGGMPANLLADQEQNVNWTLGPAQAKSDEVQIILFGTSPNEDSYALASTSRTGTVFVYLRQPTGAASRCSGTAAPVAGLVTPATCLGTFSGSW